jgi:hypothetical protein
MATSPVPASPSASLDLASAAEQLRVHLGAIDAMTASAQATVLDLRQRFPEAPGVALLESAADRLARQTASTRFTADVADPVGMVGLCDELSRLLRELQAAVAAC